MQRGWKFFGVFVLLPLLFFSGCGKKEVPKENVAYVKTVTVSPGSLTGLDVYPGQVKGRYENPLAFQISGRIIARDVHIGDFVHKGQVLMRLNPADAQQNVNKAAGAIKAAKAQLDLATSNLQRYKKLYAENAISAAMLDTYQTNYNAALANYQQAQAQGAEAGNGLGYANLTANCDGVIASISGETGQVVQAGQPVASLVQAGNLEVVVEVPENKIDSLKIGKNLPITFWALPDVKQEGTIIDISPVANAVTRTYKVEVGLANPNPRIKLGMTASVDIGTQNGKKGFILPLTAIYQIDKQPQVWLVKDGKVNLQNIKIASFKENQVVVEGLPEGAVVVTAGVNKLHAGEKVQPVNGDTL